MKRYSSYKDSGVEWIGEIPKSWGVNKMKYYVELITEKGSTSDTDIKISPENVESDTGRCFNLYSDYSGDGVPFIEGDVLLNKLRLYLKKILLTEYVGFSMGEMIVLRTREGLINKYLYRTLFIQGLIDYLDSQSQGVKLPRVSPEIILNTLIQFPPLSEQQQIVSYLDEQTISIDTLIQSKQKKITLLKEKRTSLINQIVTKGLNPNVEMKDSGVEWIGEIPSGWISTKFNRYVFFQEGPGLRTYQFTESGTKVICVTNITENGIDFTYEKFISTEEYVENYQHFTVEKGDLLLSSSGNSWGKVSEYMDDEKVMLNTSTIRLNTLSEDLFTKSLIKHLLKSDLVRKQLEILMTGSCQPNFGPSHLNQLIIPIPPLTEQMEIVEYLDRETELIDKTVSIEERKIELLKEYKQSLISEVITGKRKVVSDD